MRAFTKAAGLFLSLTVLNLALGLALKPSVQAQPFAGAAGPMITQPIVETNLVRLSGNTRPEARAANDRGRVPDSFPMAHMLLQLKRPAAQEQALDHLIGELHDRSSPNYHRWLKPEEFGARFGPVESDIQRIAGWLTRHGFRVNGVYPSRMTIDFTGSAGQVSAAFIISKSRAPPISPI